MDAMVGTLEARRLHHARASTSATKVGSGRRVLMRFLHGTPGRSASTIFSTMQVLAQATAADGDMRIFSSPAEVQQMTWDLSR